VTKSVIALILLLGCAIDGTRLLHRPVSNLISTKAYGIEIGTSSNTTLGSLIQGAWLE
jgi:hypothetical protein